MTDAVNAFSSGGNTSTDIGVKWGAAMLDPAFVPVTEALVAAGEAPDAMIERPLSYGGQNMKVMVVMTDGYHTSQYYMPEEYRTGLSDVFQGEDGRMALHVTKEVCWQETQVVERTFWERQKYWNPYKKYRKGKWRGGWDYQWVEVTRDVEEYHTVCDDVTVWVEPTSYYTSNDTEEFPGAGNQVQMTWQQVWEAWPIKTHAYIRDYLDPDTGDYNSWKAATRKSWGRSTKDARMAASCAAAKAKGIQIFTIGFEVDSDSVHTLLRECASSPAHYYDVDGLEINNAFSAIAAKVTELRLVE